MINILFVFLVWLIVLVIAFFAVICWNLRELKKIIDRLEKQKIINRLEKQVKEMSDRK